MIDLQEYLTAGFTPAQAQLLLQRDLRWQQSIESLRSDVQDGFAKLRAEIIAGFNQVADVIAQHHAATDVRLDHVEERLDHVDERLGAIDTRLDSIDTRLGAIEQAIRERPTNGQQP